MKLPLLMLVLTALLCGCSSTMEDDDSPLRKVISEINGEPVVPRKANRLFLVIPYNRSPREGLSEYLYLKIKEEISLDGRLGIVSSKEESDLILEVIISNYMIQRLEYDGIGRPVKKRMRITADVALSDRHSGRLIFREKDIQAFKEYSDVIPPIEREYKVVEDVLGSLALRIRSKTVTGWYTDQMTQIEKGKR